MYVYTYTVTETSKTPETQEERIECVCLNLRMASRAISQVYDEALRPTGLKTTQLSLLRFIRRFGPISFQKLAEKFVIDETTLPRSLGLLEKHGYIRIEAGTDRRERLASLTPKGEAVIEKALPLWRRAQERVRGRFPEQRLQKLLDELSQMRKAVTE